VHGRQPGLCSWKKSAARAAWPCTYEVRWQVAAGWPCATKPTSSKASGRFAKRCSKPAMARCSTALQAAGAGQRLRPGPADAELHRRQIAGRVFRPVPRAELSRRASDASREIRAIALNLVFADASNIGWQVTGRFPNRREGEGLLPSPGWEGRYDWDGYADPMLHPYDQDPAQGWLGTANQRVIPHGYGMQLSNSWAAPERGERLAELAGSGKHDSRSVIAMQYDQSTTFAAKLKKMFEAPGMAQPLKKAIEALPEADRSKAREALTRSDGVRRQAQPDFRRRGDLRAVPAGKHEADLPRRTGPGEQSGVESLCRQWRICPTRRTADHLLGREDSPFWDDVRTAAKRRQAGDPRPQSGGRDQRRRQPVGRRSSKRGSGANCTAMTWKNANGQTVRGPLACRRRSHHAQYRRVCLGPGLQHHAWCRAMRFHRRLRPERTADGTERLPASPAIRSARTT
jgi:hypothetical protein